jgi:alanyl-tRNA synthetase
MNSNEIRKRFLDFFAKRGHEIVPSAPLVPENDPSVLFNTAGMQPLVPYLMGQEYPTGAKRIVDSQKCVRTGDIEEIGDNTHLSFFEMLGNWSLGDYFKKEAINWSFEFLTSKEEGLGLDPCRLYVTVFEGNEDAPRDDEAAAIWTEIFEKAGLDPKKRLFYKGVKDNWWSPGDNGPCGPDSEMFYDVTGELTEGLTPEEFVEADDKQQIIEVWNDVFMEYEKKDGKVVGKLAQQNVDTGSGLERVVGVVQGKDNVFETDLFAPIFEKMQELGAGDDVRAKRIVADHIRASVFLISDGVTPSNTDQGYVLRRLLRRAVRYADQLGLPENALAQLVYVVVEKYKGAYPNVGEKKDHIVTEVTAEEEKFRRTLVKGMKEFEKVSVKVMVPTLYLNPKKGQIKSVEQKAMSESYLTGRQVFDLYQTYGFPIELTKEIAAERGLQIDVEGYEKEMKKHQDLSRTASEGKFKGGLANSSEKTTALHTCTHLMLAGLRKYLGDHVHQAGSNITEERTRFDFTHPEKVDRETLDKVEAYVNEAIIKNCTVVIEKMQKDAAKAAGVEGSFWEKYPDIVNVYVVKAEDGTIYSQELCGGPHVETTANIKGTFKIKKEESSSAGVRRIKAVLE